MKRSWLVLLLIAWAAAGWAQTPAPVSQIVVVVVGHGTDARVRDIAGRVQQVTGEYGLDPTQLQVVAYNFDDPQIQALCQDKLQIGASDLPYVGLISRSEGKNVVLFSIKNADDADKAARAAVRTARGLFASPGAASVGARAAVDPRRVQAIVEFYQRLLKTPSVLGFHPTPATVQNVMEHIRDHYADPISDAQMLQGIVHEVGDLLQAAHQSPDALNRLALDDTLPDRILAAYGSTVDRDVLGWAEVRGVLEPLDDPHSSLLTPDQTRGLNSTLQESNFAGIGIAFEMDHRTNQFVLLNVMEDTPAARAGLLPGDDLVRVDGLSTLGMSQESVHTLLQGAVGAPVSLTVKRRGGEQTFSVVRAVIRPRTVTSRLLPGNIGYLRLSTFSTNSAAEVEGTLLRWKMARVQSFILDLRNNPGGYVGTAQELCSLFLGKGEPAILLVGRGGSRQVLPSNGPGDYGGIPMVLLVNGYSASASEFTAGCLKDHHVATLVGDRTFGKGSMQQPFDLPDHTELKLTIGHFYSPSGTIIDRVGILPDVVIPMDPAAIGTEQDVQLQKAVSVLQSRH